MALNLSAMFGAWSAAPIDPTPEQARRWLIDELSQPKYQAAKPTWFDRLSAAVLDWFQSLAFSADGGVQIPVLILVALIVAVAIVGAYFIFGPPRRGRRSAVSGALFGQNDARDAAAIRAAAAAAAATVQWTLAIEEMFRCIARGLAERTIVSVSPGTTARECAGHAANALPQFRERLAAAASAFDDVRYLEREGTEAGYQAIAQLEQDLRAARPALIGATS